MIHKIEKIFAEEVKDSRRNPTIEVSVFSGDFSGTFSVPSGASTGIFEAHELRDIDGRGVKSAISKVNNEITEALLGKDVFKQKEIDSILIELDNTDNKENLGANSMIGVSIACAKLAAKISNIETYQYLRNLGEIQSFHRAPRLYLNLINGGKHARNGLAFQEYHIVPESQDVEEAISIGLNVQNSLREIIKNDLGEDSLILGDEGGFAPRIVDIQKPLEYLHEAILQNDLAGKVRLALDVAASSFFRDGSYLINNKKINKKELLEIYNSLIKKFNLLSIEDPFEENDFESFAKLKKENPALIVVGDDLTVTNKKLLQKAIDKESINGMIIKPNQIGTLSETLETMKLAKEHEIALIVSHRSGETDDDFIADLAYAYGTFGLKSGSPVKPERMVKYQRLIKISKNYY